MFPSYLLRICHEHSIENLTSAAHSVLDTAVPLNKSLLLHRLLHPVISRVEGSGGQSVRLNAGQFRHTALEFPTGCTSSGEVPGPSPLQRLHSPKLAELGAPDRMQALGLVG
jgi:hypothetical protein